MPLYSTVCWKNRVLKMQVLDHITEKESFTLVTLFSFVLHIVSTKNTWAYKHDHTDTQFFFLTHSSRFHTVEELLKDCVIQHQHWCILHRWPEAVFLYTFLQSSQALHVLSSLNAKIKNACPQVSSVVWPSKDSGCHAEYPYRHRYHV